VAVITIGDESGGVPIAAFTENKLKTPKNFCPPGRAHTTKLVAR
jgi:hypothetical protein